MRRDDELDSLARVPKILGERVQRLGVDVVLRLLDADERRGFLAVEGRHQGQHAKRPARRAELVHLKREARLRLHEVHASFVGDIEIDLLGHAEHPPGGLEDAIEATVAGLFERVQTSGQVRARHGELRVVIDVGRAAKSRGARIEEAPAGDELREVSGGEVHVAHSAREPTSRGPERGLELAVPGLRRAPPDLPLVGLEDRCDSALLVDLIDPLDHGDCKLHTSQPHRPCEAGVLVALVLGLEADLVRDVALPREVEHPAALTDRLREVLLGDPLRKERERVEHVALAARVRADENVEPAELERDVLEAPVVDGAEVRELHAGTLARRGRASRRARHAAAS